MLSIIAGMIITIIDWQSWLYWLNNNPVFDPDLHREFSDRLVVILIILTIFLFVVTAVFCLRDMTKKEIAKSTTIIVAYYAVVIVLSNLFVATESPQLLSLVFNRYTQIPYVMYETIAISGSLIAEHFNQIEMWHALSFFPFPNAPITTFLGTLLLPYVYVLFGRQSKQVK